MGGSRSSAVRTIIENLSRPVFFAGAEPGEPLRLTLYSARSVGRRPLQLEAESALRRAGIPARCRVRSLDYRRLARARSLEKLLRQFPQSDAVYDPTLSVARSRALLRCADRLRKRLGSVLKGVYVEPASRTLHLLFREDEMAKLPGDPAATRHSLASATAEVIERWLDTEEGAFPLAVRLGEELPGFGVVPIDAVSAARDSHARLKTAALRAGAITGGIAAWFGFGLSDAAMAQAVSAPNAKVSVEGGGFQENGVGLASGSIALPVPVLDNQFGVQVDGVAGMVNATATWGLGGQAFWRDPHIGLLGVVMGHVSRDHADLNLFGVEGEYYWGQFTIDGLAGYQNGDVRHGLYGKLDLSWYPIDDVKLTAGVEHYPTRLRGLAGAEYQIGLTALPGLSVFAEAAASSHGLDYGIIGFRYYFGETKTLIRRHREDDPGAGELDTALYQMGKKTPTSSFYGNTSYGGPS